MRILTVPACLLCLTLSGATMARAPAPKKPEGPWPRLVDGRPVVKTFKLRVTIESQRDLGWRAPASRVVFKIEDKDAPADYFVTIWRRRTSLKEALQAAGGQITVAATWVNLPLPHQKRMALLLSPEERWQGKRVLLGALTKPTARDKE
jgi:hypothetical protein